MRRKSFIFGERTVEDIRAMLELGGILDPFLASLESEYFAPEALQRIERIASDWVRSEWREPLKSKEFGSVPITDRIAHTAVYEILASTAALLSHDRLGRIEVTREIADESAARIERLIQSRGFAGLIYIYGAISSYENQAAMHYYGAMPENEFVTGVKHRPWVRYSLHDELMLGLTLGTYRLAVQHGRRVVMLTRKGVDNLHNTREILRKSGYLDHRLRMIYISQFDVNRDWDQLAERFNPTLARERQAFLEFAGIKPGSSVLEVGCGTGLLTFEAGLADLVQPGGSLVVTDPSLQMLERLKQKRADRGAAAEHVQVIKAAAETLPFSNRMFDATVGALFLHFTDKPKAISEMLRVTRSGGTVAAMVVCRPNYMAHPWFREWFAPALELLARNNATNRDYFTVPGEAAELFHQAGLRDIEVRAVDFDGVFEDVEVGVGFLTGISFFQKGMESLPWEARKALINELRARGEAVCTKTDASERIITGTLEFIKGVVA